MRPPFLGWQLVKIKHCTKWGTLSSLLTRSFTRRQRSVGNEEAMTGPHANNARLTWHQSLSFSSRVKGLTPQTIPFTMWSKIKQDERVPKRNYLISSSRPIMKAIIVIIKLPDIKNEIQKTWLCHSDKFPGDSWWHHKPNDTMIQSSGPKFEELLHEVFIILWQHKIQPKTWQVMQADDGEEASPPSSLTAPLGSEKCTACPVLIPLYWPLHFWLSRSGLPASEATASTLKKTKWSFSPQNPQFAYLHFIFFGEGRENRMKNHLYSESSAYCQRSWREEGNRTIEEL